MRSYEVELDEAVSNFFEELLSDALSKQFEIISRKISETAVIDDEFCIKTTHRMVR